MMCTAVYYPSLFALLYRIIHRMLLMVHMTQCYRFISDCFKYQGFILFIYFFFHLGRSFLSLENIYISSWLQQTCQILYEISLLFGSYRVCLEKKKFLLTWNKMYVWKRPKITKKLLGHTKNQSCYWKRQSK